MPKQELSSLVSRLSSLNFFKYESDEEEVGGDGDGIDTEGCQLAAESHPEPEVEEGDLQAVVEEVGSAEADSVALGGFLVEGEMGGEIVVDEEAEDIADGIGDIDVEPVLQQPVEGVVDGGGDDTDDAEAQNFAQCFFLHGCKDTINN